MWFKRKSQRPPEKRREHNVRFICEQDGVPERELKNALIPALSQHALVRKAYLARVDFGDPSVYNVALCLSAPKDDSVVKAVSTVFGGIFNTSQHLDILFLNDAKETELTKVCRPFYAAS